jgi:hypothetical protein
MEKVICLNDIHRPKTMMIYYKTVTIMIAV